MRPSFNVGLGNPYASLEAAVPFLEKHGIGKTNEKLKAYFQILSDSNALKIEKYDIDEFYSIWRQLHEAAFVVDALRINDISVPSELLQKAFSGSLLANHEPDSDPARNFMLELRVAVYFIAAGAKVWFDSGSDVTADYQGKRIYVECKRLYSVPKIAKRIGDASKQLSSRFAKCKKRSGSLGIVWLDPSPILLRACPLYQAGTRHAAHLAARLDMDHFYNQHVTDRDLIKEPKAKLVVCQFVWSCQMRDNTPIHTGFTAMAYPAHRRTGFFTQIYLRNLLKSLMPNLKS